MKTPDDRYLREAFIPASSSRGGIPQVLTQVIGL